MALIQHGCMIKNADGTNKLIGPGRKCLVPTDECFWKNPWNAKKCQMKSRSRTKKEPTVSIKDYKTYMQQRQWIDHWVLPIERKDN